MENADFKYGNQINYIITNILHMNEDATIISRVHFDSDQRMERTMMKQRDSLVIFKN